MSSTVPADQAGAAVKCQHCGTGFILPEVPEAPFPEKKSPARALSQYLLPVLAGAGLVVALSLCLPGKPAADPSLGSSPVPAPPVLVTTKEPVRPRPARPPLPKPDDTETKAPSPAEIYGPTQTVASRTQPDSPKVIPRTSSPPKAPDGSASSLPSDEKPAALSPKTLAPAPEAAAAPATEDTALPPPANPGILAKATPVAGDAGPAPVPAPATESDAGVQETTALGDSVKVRRDSRTALEHFLQANTMVERRAVSQNPDKIKAGMETYYQKNPEGPLAFTELALLTEGEVPETKRALHLYNVFLKDRGAPVPVAVEETRDGFRVDWESFTEGVSTRLHDFFAAPTGERGRFRVLLRRAHYFGPPVPGQDTTRLAYSVEPPAREETFHVWADLDSTVYQEKLATGDRASWEAESYVIVELVWRGDEQRGRWVGLSRIVSDSWRND